MSDDTFKPTPRQEGKITHREGKAAPQGGKSAPQEGRRQDDFFVFEVRHRFYYKGINIETLTKEQLIVLIKRILKKTVFK